LQVAFAQLTDDELEVARMRMLGIPYVEISEALGMLDEEVEKLWKRARRKLGRALFGSENSAPSEPAPPANPDPGSNTGTPQETEGTSST
jgi:hypothetical protein